MSNSAHVSSVSAHLTTIELKSVNAEENDPCWEYALKVAPIGEQPTIKEIRKRVVNVCHDILVDAEITKEKRREFELEIKKKLQLARDIHALAELHSRQFNELINALRAYRNWMAGDGDTELLRPIWKRVSDALDKWKDK